MSLGRDESVLGRNLAVGVVVSALVLATALLTDLPVLDPGVLTGLAVVAVALLLSATPVRSRVPRAWSSLVPVALLLGLVGLAVGGLPVAPVAVLPTLTLARFHGRLGAVGAVLLGAAVAWAPQLPIGRPLDEAALPGLLVMPLVLVMVAAVTLRLESMVQARGRLIEQQDRHVRELLDRLDLKLTSINAIVAALPHGVALVDEQGQILLANLELQRLTESTGQDLRAADSPVLRAVLGEVDTDPATASGPTRWITLPSGRRAALRTSSFHAPSFLASSDQTGALVRVVLVEDLTVQEEALAQREDFLLALSDSLRNPMTAVLLSLDLLRDVPGMEESEHVTVAERSALRMMREVEALLAAASLQAGTFRLEDRLVDLAEVVSEVVEELAPSAAASRVEIVSRGPRRSPIRGDRDRLAQVVRNVLGNAITYSVAGGRVTTELTLSGEHVVLSVSDAGIGMAQEDRLRAFERFFRAPSVIRSSRHGTGLGLHVAREIVLRHGGEITIRSLPGNGTRVEVVLPVKLRPTRSAT